MLEAEGVLREHPLGAKAVVLRLAGLYGPGRVPRMADLLAGRPIAASTEGHLNLIHVDDAAEVVVSAQQRAVLPATYVVSDGHPVSRPVFYLRLAELLGVDSPEFIEPDPDSARAQRGGGDKKVSNLRMLRELDVELKYPSFREGLADVAGHALRAE